MPNSLEKSLIGRKIAVQKVIDTTSEKVVYQEQMFGNINAAKTEDDYKAVADNIGWMMQNYDGIEQPTNAYQLDQFLLSKVV